MPRKLHIPRQTMTLYLVKLDMGDGTDEEIVVRAKTAAGARRTANAHFHERFLTVANDYTATPIDLIEEK